MGYCVIEVVKNSFTIKTIDALKLSSKKDPYLRLQLVHEKVTQLVQEFSPDEFAIEAPFFGKNVQSMLKLGRAQGVAIAAAMSRDIPVTEYSPKKVKQSITGNGNADKEQVWKMLQRILYMPDKPALFDATDAVAVALCHYYETQSGLPATATANKKLKGWEAFIKENPGKIRTK